MITRTFLSLLLFVLSTCAVAGEFWAPNRGYSSVNQSYADAETYEQETQVYNNLFADYNDYWSSNLPQAYYDAPFQDETDNFTIGSFQGTDLEPHKQYYTYMALKKGNSSDCRGCCSSHGGVVCNSGTPACRDGTPLSETCAAKGCNQCLNEATVRIKGQKGERIPSGCYSTFCVFANATTGSMCILNAPAYSDWTY